MVRGGLSSDDSIDPARPNCFYDDYLLSGSLLRPGQELTANLNAHVNSADLSSLQFDPYLQLINANNGQVIDYNDNSGSGDYPFNLNSELTFTVQEGLDYILRATSSENLETGSYTFRISDWYRDNLGDLGVRTLARESALDGKLSRNEMMSIFQHTKDYGDIDATELTDLRALVDDRQSLMPDYVHNLSDKIANGNRANQWWTGGSQTHQYLGNLYAGASAHHLQKLMDKWFLGRDHPTATSSATYRFVEGSLFQNGISENDIAQGACGDCGYLATLASAAVEKTFLIQDMFIGNGDNTYTVRFYNNGVADYVTVDRYLPTRSSGYRVYAGWGGGSYNESNNELWVALAEKAVAQWSESGLIGTSFPQGTNSYRSIEGLYRLAIVSGLPTTWKSLNAMTEQELIDLSNSNQLLTANVHTSDLGFVRAHAYAITDYNESNGTFHFHNPWGYRHVDLTWDQLMSTTDWIGIDWTAV